MSNTTDSTRILKTAVTACRWIGLAILAAMIIMAIARVTSFMSHLSVIVITFGAIADDMLVRSRIRVVKGEY